MSSAKRQQLQDLIENLDWRRALALGERLSRTHPRDPQLLSSHAFCLLQLGRPLDVLQLYHERRSRLQGHDADLQTSLGLARREVGLPLLALRTLRGCLPEHHEGNCHVLRELEKQVQALLLDRPEEQALREQEAEELLLIGDNHGLLKQGAAWLAEFPHSGSLRATLAQAYLQTDQLEAGIQMAEQASGTDPAATYRHVCLLLADGRQKRAREVAGTLIGFQCQNGAQLDFVLRTFGLLNWNRRVLETARRCRSVKRTQEVKFGIMSALCALGRFAAARKIFRSIPDSHIDPDERKILATILKTGNLDRGMLRGWLLMDLMSAEMLQDLSNWLGRTPIDGLQPGSRALKETARFLKRFPRCSKLVPWILRFAEQRHKMLAWFILLVEQHNPELTREARTFVRDARIPLPLTRHMVLMMLGSAGHVLPGVYCLRVGKSRVPAVVDSFTWATHLEFRDSPRAFELLNHAATLLNQHRFGDAETLLLQGLEHAPDNPDLQYHLSICREFLGQKERAAASVARCLAVDPEHPGARLSRARQLALDGAVEEASRIWREVSRLDSLWLGFRPEFYAAKLAILARKDPRRARAWAESWQTAMPNHPMRKLCGYQEHPGQQRA